jgi:hypothetical protein
MTASSGLPQATQSADCVHQKVAIWERGDFNQQHGNRNSDLVAGAPIDPINQGWFEFA